MVKFYNQSFVALYVAIKLKDVANQCGPVKKDAGCTSVREVNREQVKNAVCLITVL